MKTVATISTGTELLTGRVVDTNGAFISGRLISTSLEIMGHSVVGDDAAELERAVRDALSRVDIVIVTGGLGPTDDDITVESLSRIFGTGVVRVADAEKKMNAFFSSLGMSPSEKDLKMIEVPEGALVIPNDAGLAPGFLIETGGKWIIAMPGVPREMSCMFDARVLPLLLEKAGTEPRRNLVFRILGMRESDINARVQAMDFPRDAIDWGVTAGGGVTSLCLIQKHPAAPFDERALTGRVNELFGGRLLSPGFDSQEEEVLSLLAMSALTLAIAESCTGGLISKRITDVPGASKSFAGSVVAYSNAVKTSILGVDAGVIERFGAVSEETARGMAGGVRKALSADIGISTTGIAGPDGGSPEKPVGTVCFGYADASNTFSFTRTFAGDRKQVRSFAALFALELLRSRLHNLPLEM